MIETLPQFREKGEDGSSNLTFTVIEIISIIIFTVEYCTRLACVTSLPMFYLDPESMLPTT